MDELEDVVAATASAVRRALDEWVAANGNPFEGLSTSQQQRIQAMYEGAIASAVASAILQREVVIRAEDDEEA